MTLSDAFKGAAASAFAPATIGNMVVGFDVLGGTLAHVGDVVKVALSPAQSETVNQVIIKSIEGTDGAKLPLEAANNTAGKAILSFLEGESLHADVTVEIQKGIPLGSGLGGSAASAVAAVVALNELLKDPLPEDTLLLYALDGEAVASGARHADNVAPALYGGLVGVFSVDPISIGRIPLPPGLSVAVIKPDVGIKTEEARALLAESVPTNLVIKQQARLAAFILGCAEGDYDLIAEHFIDEWIEPQRKSLIPHFDEVQASASGPGVLGASISGAGPAIFALCENEQTAARAGKRMQEVYEAHGVASQVWVCEIPHQGAHILDS